MKKINIIIIISITILINSFFTVGINLHFQESNLNNHNVLTSYYGDNANYSNGGIAYMVETGENTGVYE